MVPFAGFEMPVQYAGILKEHDAVRNRAGLFDLSHMGQFGLDGDRVAEWADTLATNAVATMKPMQARYNIFCNERGGAHDDTIFYRLRRPLAARRQRRQRRRRCGRTSARTLRRPACGCKTGTARARSSRFKVRSRSRCCSRTSTSTWRR